MATLAPNTDQLASLDEALEASLEKFLPHAPIADAAQLRDFLPADQALAPFVLVELVKLDMAVCAEAGQQPRIERYCEAFPDLLPIEQAPFDLVIEEFQLRREFGGDPKQAEYAQRFPQHAVLLERFSCNAETVARGGRPAAPGELYEGDEIDDFTIVQELGRGAFARVYLARQRSMHRLVALKVSAGTGDEPQALAQFDHPNIVRVYDQRHVEGGQNHLLYMQYLPGGTLADVVKRCRWDGPENRGGRLVVEAVDDNLLHAAQQTPEDSAIREWLQESSWPVTIAWLGGQLARALDEAHRRGVLHRDVKPANVLLTAEGTPKLADFNVSMAGAAGRAGAAANLGGSIGYMAPEHLAAIGGLPDTDPEDVREHADIYSLAVLLWELWQGHRPFEVGREADSWTDALASQIVSREQPLREPQRLANDSAERVLETALREALSYKAEDRPAHAGEFAGRLQLALHPDAAEVFDPPAGGWRIRLLALPAILLIGATVLLPNVAAGLFNYFYNEREIIQVHPEMKPFFVSLSTVVNCTAFPLGIVLAGMYGWPVARSIWKARQGKAASSAEIDEVFKLSHRGALLGGALWGIASLVFPIALSIRFPQFPFQEAAHFCLSLLICGGVAAIYPYFLMNTAIAALYYPLLVRPSMRDPDFDLRGERLRRYGERYLCAAALVPLAAIILLMLLPEDRMSRDMIVASVLITICGLFAAFNSYRYVLRVWERIRPVLSNAKSGRTILTE